MQNPRLLLTHRSQDRSSAVKEDLVTSSPCFRTFNYGGKRNKEDHVTELDRLEFGEVWKWTYGWKHTSNHEWTPEEVKGPSSNGADLESLQGGKVPQFEFPCEIAETALGDPDRFQLLAVRNVERASGVVQLPLRFVRVSIDLRLLYEGKRVLSDFQPLQQAESVDSEEIHKTEAIISDLQGLELGELREIELHELGIVTSPVRNCDWSHRGFNRFDIAYRVGTDLVKLIADIYT